MRYLVNKKLPLLWPVPRLLIAAFAGAALWLSTTAPAASQSKSALTSGLTGLWLDHTRRGAVDITKCGRRALCGRIVWMKTPNKKNGRPFTDRHNPVKSKRRQKICGLQIIRNVKRISRRVFDNGRIYDPEKGKEFDVELRLVSTNILQVKGYLGIKLLSETFLWKRAPGDLERCAK